MHPAFQLLAQADQGPPGNPFLQFMPIIAIVVLGYFMLLRPARQQEQKRQGMIAALKKNDDVVTTGGIIGTVVNIKPNKDEVTIESGSSRLRILKSSIAQVLTRGAGTEDATDTTAADDRVEK